MAQHDYDIANQTFPNTRADINDALAAIVSNNSGTTAPATTFAYMWWPDTTTGLLKQRNAANSAWITIGTLASANLGLLPLSGGAMTGAIDEVSATIASASTVNIGAATGNYVAISGTTTITAFDTAQAGTRRTLVFQGSLTLTHNGTSLILPGAANIATAAGDTAEFVSEGGGNWRCSYYRAKAGQALATATNDSAGTGRVGEHSESNIASGSAVSLTSATAANVTSLSLTAGDWEVYGYAQYIGNSATVVTLLSASLSATSATVDASNDRFAEANFPSQTVLQAAPSAYTRTVGPARFSLSTTTTVYLVANAGFSVNSCSVYGKLRARRVR